MLKDKEVVSDPQRQYEIARQVHASQHGGINKTTATIAEKYHWVRIKETVSLVIKNCPDCKESMRPAPTMRTFADVPTSGAPAQPRPRRDNGNSNSNHTQNQQHSLIERLIDLNDLQPTSTTTATHMHDDLSMQSHPQSMADIQHHHHLPPSPSPYDGLPLDPQIIHSHSHTHPHQHIQSPSPQSFEAQLRRATHEADRGNYGLELLSQQPDDVHHDTRLATGRHVRDHDEPMAFVHEGDDEDGGFDIGDDERDRRGEEDGLHDGLVDFDGRAV